MFKKREKGERVLEIKRVYYLKLFFGNGECNLEYLKENVRTEVYNRIQKAILENKQVEIGDKNQKRLLLLKPREIIYIRIGEDDEVEE